MFSAWLPGGATGEVNAAATDMVRRALGATAPPTPFAWHDQSAIAALFATHDMTVTVERHELAFTAASPQDFLEEQRTSHPMAIAGFEVLERIGQAEAARTRLLQILEEGNEDPTGFSAPAAT